METGNPDLVAGLSAHITKVASWVKESVSTLANDIGAAILDDLPEFRSQLERECLLLDARNSTSGFFGADTPYDPEITNILLKRETYFDDSTLNEYEGFRDFVYSSDELASLLDRYSSLAMIVTRYSDSQGISEQDIYKRVMYKLKNAKASSAAGESPFTADREVSEEIIDGMVIVSVVPKSGDAGNSVLILDDDGTEELTEWC